MNKELYIKHQKYLKESQKLFCLIQELKKFLSESEDYFKNKKSIEALKKIKAFLEIKKIESKDICKTKREVERELYLTCNHEVAIRPYYLASYQCLICKRTFKETELDNISDSPFILIDIGEGEIETAYILENTFEDIVHSDKDLVETINNVVLEMQYDRDIKIYRRTK